MISATLYSKLIWALKINPLAQDTLPKTLNNDKETGSGIKIFNFIKKNSISLKIFVLEY